jgi:hypothetical protein
MFIASREQLEAHKRQTDENQARETGWEKQNFIREFLELAERVTSGTSGGGRTAVNHRFMEWDFQGSSEHVKVPTPEGTPVMGAQIVAYRQEVKRRRFREQLIASKVTAAEVQIGPIVNGTFPHIADARTVLKVYSHPPLILGEASTDDWFSDDVGLVDLNPMSEGWGNVTDLGATLASKESELVSRFKNK